jgi:hypothetical protein
MTEPEDIQRFLIEAKPRARLWVSEGVYVRRGTTETGGGSYTFQFRWKDGTQREIGLGSVGAMRLEIALVVAARCAAQVRGGMWPGLGPERPPRPAPEIRDPAPEEAPCATPP